MQPLRLAGDAEPRLVHMLDRCASHEIARRVSKAPQTFGAIPAHSGDRGGSQIHAEEIGHQFGQAILGQKLIVQQIDHERPYSAAILHRRVDAIWKPPARCRAADGAWAIVRTMFGDDERLRLGQIKHLTGDMAGARFRIEASATRRAGRWVMIDHFVGIGDLSQGLAFVSLLPARFVTRTFAQALYPRRLLQPVTRRWLAAVRTVQSEPALKFSDMGFQRRNQRNEFFPRWFCRRFAIHRILESKSDSVVEKIPHRRLRKKHSLTWAVTKILGLLLRG